MVIDVSVYLNKGVVIISNFRLNVINIVISRYSLNKFWIIQRLVAETLSGVCENIYLHLYRSPVSFGQVTAYVHFCNFIRIPLILSIRKCEQNMCVCLLGVILVCSWVLLA